MTPSAPSQDEALDAYIDAASSLLGLPVAAEWRGEVKMNLRVTLIMAAKIAEFPLPDDAESAPVFTP